MDESSYRYSYLEAPQSPETLKRGSWSTESGDPLLPRNPPQTEIKVYAQYPFLIYLTFSGFFVLITTLPLVFVAHTGAGIHAPKIIAEFSSTHLHLTPQIVAIFCSFLTASVKWALAGVVTLRAQKHFQRSRPAYKMEVFSALKNGGIAWSWKKHPGLTFWTFVVVVLTGLLTSGFVALITPFPISTLSNIAENTLVELNLGSPDTSCHQWFTNAMGILSSTSTSDCPNINQYPNSTFFYSNCRNVDPFGDVLNAAKSSMISRFSSGLPPNRASAAIHSFAQLNHTRISGSTAGALAIGPEGVDISQSETTGLRLRRSITDLSYSYNYTLNLQGVWADASCSYTDSSLLEERSGNRRTSYVLNCPPGEDAEQITKEVDPEITRSGAILAGLCSNESSGKFTFHIRSFWNSSDTSPPTAASPLYAGIGAMQCELTPSIGLVNAVYQTDLAAFNMTRQGGSRKPYTEMEALTKDLVRDAMGSTLRAVDFGHTQRTGNMYGAAISSVAILYGNVNGQQKNALIQDLVADALRGVFEFKVTNLRVILTLFKGPPPDLQCLRNVTGSIHESGMGWQFERSTLVGLIPLGIISLACLLVIGHTALRKGKLTIFDPTSPISLIAAASGGRLEFAHEKESLLIGDPDDEVVMDAKVRYGEYDGRWGLKSK